MDDEFELRMVLLDDKQEIERLTRNLIKEKENDEPFDEQHGIK